jgi:hypothetical protein
MMRKISRALEPVNVQPSDLMQEGEGRYGTYIGTKHVNKQI